MRDILRDLIDQKLLTDCGNLRCPQTIMVRRIKDALESSDEWDDE